MEKTARDELKHDVTQGGLKVEVSGLDDSFFEEQAVKEEKSVEM